MTITDQPQRVTCPDCGETVVSRDADFIARQCPDCDGTRPCARVSKLLGVGHPMTLNDRHRMALSGMYDG